MTLRHFEIFVAVCDAMNMTAAASALYMSQSAVSQAIAELERQYELRLFERLNRKLYLTQGGDTLLGYARHIIRLNRDAEHAMRDVSQSGVVRIGASVSIAASLLPSLVSGIQREDRGIQLVIKEDNTAQLEALLLCDQLDLALVEGDIVSTDLLSFPFAEDPLVLICGKNHPFALRGEVAAQELSDENFILRELGSGTRKTFELSMAAHPLSWKSSWTCCNAETIKQAVAEGLGISALSGRIITRELEEGSLRRVPVRDIRFIRQFKLVYHKNKYVTQGMHLVIQSCFAAHQTVSFP